MCGKIDYMQYDNVVLQYWERSDRGAVGIAVCYRLNGLGIKSQWEGSIFHANQTSPNAHSTSVQWVASLSKGLNRPQCGADSQPSLSTGCNGSALYLHLPSVPAHRCHGVTFIFTTNVDWMKHLKICHLWTYYRLSDMMSPEQY
jgi:hypothetical protein